MSSSALDITGISWAETTQNHYMEWRERSGQKSVTDSGDGDIQTLETDTNETQEKLRK